MANVNITIDAVTFSVPAGGNSVVSVLALVAPFTKVKVPKLRNLTLNQKYSYGDMINIAGGEVLST